MLHQLVHEVLRKLRTRKNSPAFKMYIIFPTFPFWGGPAIGSFGLGVDQHSPPLFLMKRRARLNFHPSCVAGLSTFILNSGGFKYVFRVSPPKKKCPPNEPNLKTLFFFWSFTNDPLAFPSSKIASQKRRVSSFDFWRFRAKIDPKKGKGSASNHPFFRGYV